MVLHERTVAMRLRETLAELTRATAARHRLRRATPEYVAAIEEEIRLAAEVRRLIDEQRREDSQT